MTTPTIGPPVILQAALDLRLSPLEQRAVAVLWSFLTPSQYMPCKMERVGLLLGVRRQNASKIMNKLIALGYVLVYTPPDRNQPREYLLVNVVQQRAA